MSNDLNVHAERLDVVHLPHSDVALSYKVTLIRDHQPVCQHQVDFGHEVLAKRGEGYCENMARQLVEAKFLEGRL